MFLKQRLSKTTEIFLFFSSVLSTNKANASGNYGDAQRSKHLFKIQ